MCYLLFTMSVFLFSKQTTSWPCYRNGSSWPFRSGLDSPVGKIRWRRYCLPTAVFLGFPCGSAGKESACNAGELGLIPEWGRPLEKGKATHSRTLVWRIPWTIKFMGVAKRWTRLSEFHFSFAFFFFNMNV